MLSDLHNNNVHAEDDLLEFAQFLGYGDVHMKVDKKTGLKAIIAVHSNKLGPAIGGTRCIAYPNSEAAIRDALRLANMMSYKAAICNLPHGGGKSVVMLPPEIKNRAAMFEKFGEFVDSIGGRYIAAMDAGTHVSDMDNIAKSTKFVTCTSDAIGNGNPGPHTAFGVFRGLEATVNFKTGSDDLSNIHVAIQGVGHVGYYLAKLLHENGARLTVCDMDETAVARCVEEFNASSVGIDDIYDVDCDIFAPCALGGVVNEQTIPRLKASMIVGSANNQLSSMSLDKVLFEKGILYAPDFLVNAGGLIHVAGIYDYGKEEKARDQIVKLYDETLNLFKRAEQDQKPTNEIAVTIAEERLRD